MFTSRCAGLPRPRPHFIYTKCFITRDCTPEGSGAVSPPHAPQAQGDAGLSRVCTMGKGRVEGGAFPKKRGKKKKKRKNEKLKKKKKRKNEKKKKRKKKE